MRWFEQFWDAWGRAAAVWFRPPPSYLEQVRLARIRINSNVVPIRKDDDAL